MDAVITYVNCAVESWRNTYKKYVNENINEERFRDVGTLKYLVNGIRTNMKFIENIFIVVSDKNQITIDLHKYNVKIVTHDKIIPIEYLPCFNSCTIEMFLHNIPGLNEQFIYFNDDMYCVDSSLASDFFIDGKPSLKPKIMDVTKFDKIGVYRSNCINSTELICSKFGIKGYTNKAIIHQHCMRPVTKTSYKIVWDKCKKEILKSLTRTRHSRNYNIYLFNDYDVLTGNYVNKGINYQYYPITDVDKITSFLANPTKSYLCVNDVKDAPYDNIKDKIIHAFEHMFCNRVDVMLPYVDADDPFWAEIYNKYCPVSNKKQTNWEQWATGMQRFRSNDLLKYVFRSIEKFVPFVNNVYLLVMQDSQVPSWINRDTVKIITHKDFIPEKFLPTFNSSTIEMFLNKVPGLSEKFIYGNDDMFFTSEVAMEDFFVNDTPVYFVKRRDYREHWVGDFLRHEDRKLLTGVDDNIVDEVQHIWTPYLKSTLDEVLKKHKTKLLNNSTRFREKNNYNQWVYSLYQYYYKDMINSRLPYFHCEVIQRNRKRYDRNWSKYKAICLNDSADTTEKDLSILHNKFEHMFPNKSKYEN